MAGGAIDRGVTPKVFVSSTAEDLKPYRAAARDAAIGAELLPKMMEYFVASGDKPPLPACLDRVSEADVLVVIVAHRYGWVPPDQKPGERKSITWLECERAVAEGKEVLAFLVDDKVSWPDEHRERHQITMAVDEGRATPELLATVQDNVARLKELKRWLSSGRVRATFVSPEDLRGKVSDALREWRQRHRPAGNVIEARSVRPAADPAKYLRAQLPKPEGRDAGQTLILTPQVFDEQHVSVLVRNDGPPMEFVAQVVGVEGGEIERPTPWTIPWRDKSEDRCHITTGTEAALKLAHVISYGETYHGRRHRYGRVYFWTTTRELGAWIGKILRVEDLPAHKLVVRIRIACVQTGDFYPKTATISFGRDSLVPIISISDTDPDRAATKPETSTPPRIPDRSLADIVSDFQRERENETFPVLQANGAVEEYSRPRLDRFSASDRERLFDARPEMKSFWHGKPVGISRGVSSGCREGDGSVDLRSTASRKRKSENSWRETLISSSGMRQM